MLAKLIDKWAGENGTTVLQYQYKGKNYIVTDYGWNGGEPLSWQHKNAQAYIDKQIKIERKQQSTENAQIGLDLFFETFEI